MVRMLLYSSFSTALSVRVTMPKAGFNVEYPVNIWKELITSNSCPASTELTTKTGEVRGTILCESKDGLRKFKFPAGMFDIDEQVAVPANTEIEGNSNPNDPSDKTKKPDPSTQTFFIATSGVTDPHAAYCGTNNNLQQGEAQKLRIGFLLHSNTLVRNINYQGKDTTRPYDNGSLCGGGVFETPGCVSPGFGDGNGWQWLADDEKSTGCYDHAGGSNDLLIGDGKGVENIVIENVRLNDLLLPSENRLEQGQGSQVALWVAQTQDGSATKNVRVTNLVGTLFRGDGINFHGNAQDSLVEDCHIENTGDDIYAVWGGYTRNSSHIVFRNNVGKNTGATRGFGYGVCIAVYGTMYAEFTGTKCYDRRHWNSGQDPSGNSGCLNGPYCNSCMAYVHDNWFGAIYAEGNEVHFRNNDYFYMDDGSDILASDRPQIRHDRNSGANIVLHS